LSGAENTDRLARQIPSLPRNDDGPAFREPWEAQAFAMAVSLNEAGVFEWSEWAATISAEIAAAGPDDAPENYYRRWLAALEKLVTAKDVASNAELAERKAAWDRAARATPHGEPIVLGRETSSDT